MALIGSIAINMKVQTSALSKGLKSSQAMIGQFSARVQQAGGALQALFAGAAAYSAAKGLKSMVMTASDLNENMSKTQAIFGSGSQTVVSAAERMAAAFGVSRNEFIDAAGRMGGLFKGAGFAADDTAKLSVEFTKLAADASSFFNLPFDQAFTKLRAGLSGESEPLKDLGILMNEDMVKAKALAMGLAKPGEALSNGAKVQARAAIIMQGLADAQGDLAKTADGVANRTREFGGRVENLAGTLGTVLQPIAQSVLGEMSTAVQALSLFWEDNQNAVIAWGQGAVGAVGQTAAGVGWLQKAVGFVADAWQTMKLGFLAAQSFITTGLSYIISGLSKLGYAIDFAVEQLSGFKSGIGDYLKTFGEDLDRLGNEQWKGFMTELAKPPASDGVNQFFARAQDKIKAVRKEAAKGGPIDLAKMTPRSDVAAAKDQGPKFAAALVAGSREANNAILRSRYGAGLGDKKPEAETARNTRQMVGLLAKIAGGTARPADVSGAVFSGNF